jgi:threonine dehydrogenase-like Zn-dependent dehydrogenase
MMRALTVEPGKAGTAEVRDVPYPQPAAGDLLVEGLALGICDTDQEIMAGDYGWAPPGPDRLVLGNEFLGRIRTDPPAADWRPVTWSVGARSWFGPKRVLVTGAGPIGMLAVLLGVQRGLDVHVLDVATSGAKVTALGATYHSSGMGEVTAQTKPDIMIEATGLSSLIFEAMAGTAPYGIVCLTGVSPVGRKIDVGAANRDMVLENDAVIGSVNANLTHYAAAAAALAEADTDWLAPLITRRIPLERFAEALYAQPDDIKVVITLN